MKCEIYSFTELSFEIIFTSIIFSEILFIFSHSYSYDSKYVFMQDARYVRI